MKKRFVPALLVALIGVAILLPLSRWIENVFSSPTPIVVVEDQEPWVLINGSDGSQMECDSVRVEQGVWIADNCVDPDGNRANYLIKYPAVWGAFQDLKDTE